MLGFKIIFGAVLGGFWQFWVGDIKTLLVKVIIFLVSRGSSTDLFEVSWESESAHFSCLVRQSRARTCATQSLNWHLGCNLDFTNECIKVKFNGKHRERVCTKMHLISLFQNEYSQYPCAPKIPLNRVVNNVKIIRMVKLWDFYKTTFWKKNATTTEITTVRLFTFSAEYMKPKTSIQIDSTTIQHGVWGKIK